MKTKLEVATFLEANRDEFNEFCRLVYRKNGDSIIDECLQDVGIKLLFHEIWEQLDECLQDMPQKVLKKNPGVTAFI